MAYGGGWCLFETLEFGFNVFESFRQGESAFILGQVLRAYHHVFSMRTVVVDPYQLGADNLEALRSGAFYFYHRLGFRPRDPEVLERSRGGAREDRGRSTLPVSPLPVLRRLARGEAYLTLPGGSREPERRVRARDLAGLVTRDDRPPHEGTGGPPSREAIRRVGARPSARPRWTAWPAAGAPGVRDVGAGPRPRPRSRALAAHRAPTPGPRRSAPRADAERGPVRPAARRPRAASGGAWARGSLGEDAARGSSASGRVRRPGAVRRRALGRVASSDAGDHDQGAHHVGPGHGLPEEDPGQRQHLEGQEVHREGRDRRRHDAESPVEPDVRDRHQARRVEDRQHDARRHVGQRRPGTLDQ